MRKQSNKIRIAAIAMACLGSCTAFAAPVAAPRAEGGQGVGNGGGGVQIGGRYMTFYSAGIMVDPDPKSEVDVPSLDYTIDAIQRMDFLSPNTRDKISSAISPSPQHRYYRVDPSSLDPKKIEDLVSVYQKVTHVDPSQIALYALTDIEKRRTFLLPDFYKLSTPEEQAAILFHEAYWLLHPKSTYESVVAAESAFQAVLSHPGDQATILRFMERSSTLRDQYTYAIRTDLRTGALRGFIDSSGNFKIGDLLGESTVRCLHSAGVPDRGGCTSYYILNLRRLIQAHPASLFLRVLQAVTVPADEGGPINIYGVSDGPSGLFSERIFFARSYPEFTRSATVQIVPHQDGEGGTDLFWPVSYSGPTDNFYLKNLRLEFWYGSPEMQIGND
jgi:hypothetical protein